MARYARRPSGQRFPPGPWKHGQIPVIGLIGGIGAGKSLVAATLARRGARVIDTDSVGHALLTQKPVRDLVIQRFGEEIVDRTDPKSDEPTINRKTLAGIVFHEPTSLRALEAILHPRMRRTCERAILRTARRLDAPMVVLDAAVLLEAGWDDLCDSILFVDTPFEIRVQRLSESRGWDVEQLEARERAQWPLSRKKDRADFVLSNSSTPEKLDEEVEMLWSRLLRPDANLSRGRSATGDSEVSQRIEPRSMALPARFAKSKSAGPKRSSRSRPGRPFRSPGSGSKRPSR